METQEQPLGFHGRNGSSGHQKQQHLLTQSTVVACSGPYFAVQRKRAGETGRECGQRPHTAKLKGNLGCYRSGSFSVQRTPASLPFPSVKHQVGEDGDVSPFLVRVFLAHLLPPLLLPFHAALLTGILLSSPKELIGSRRRTGRRWRSEHLTRKRSTSLPMKPQSSRRWGPHAALAVLFNRTWLLWPAGGRELALLLPSLWPGWE